MRTNIFYLAIFAGLLCCFKLSAQEKIVYTDAKNFTLVGKATPTESLYHRIDTLLYNDMPAPVKELFTNSAGLAIAFKTNSQVIRAKWCVTDKPAMSNMTPITQKGLDLYIKRDGRWEFAGVGRPSKTCSNTLIVENMDDTGKVILTFLLSWFKVLSGNPGILI